MLYSSLLCWRPCDVYDHESLHQMLAMFMECLVIGTRCINMLDSLTLSPLHVPLVRR